MTLSNWISTKPTIRLARTIPLQLALFHCQGIACRSRFPPARNFINAATDSRSRHLESAVFRFIVRPWSRPSRRDQSVSAASCSRYIPKFGRSGRGPFTGVASSRPGLHYQRRGISSQQAPGGPKLLQFLLVRAWTSPGHRHRQFSLRLSGGGALQLRAGTAPSYDETGTWATRTPPTSAQPGISCSPAGAFSITSTIPSAPVTKMAQTPRQTVQAAAALHSACSFEF